MSKKRPPRISRAYRRGRVGNVGLEPYDPKDEKGRLVVPPAFVLAAVRAVLPCDWRDAGLLLRMLRAQGHVEAASWITLNRRAWLRAAYCSSVVAAAVGANSGFEASTVKGRP